MKMNKKKLWIVILASLILSIGLSFLFPSNIGAASRITELNLVEEKSLVSQKIEAITLSPETITKIYYKGNLVGSVTDGELLEKAIGEIEQDYNGTIYDGYKLRLSQDIYTLTEKSFWVYEDKDEEIIQYLIDHDLFVTEATRIDIVNDEGKIKDTIYVRSVDDFTSALRKYALCFIDEDVYFKLENNETISDLQTYGVQDKNIYVEETIKATTTGASVEDIFYDENSIFMYLCYGRDYSLDYYEVEEFDTIYGVASQTGLTAYQVVALNRDQLDNVDQALKVGQKLVITYFNSPINVVVFQQRISKIITYPEAAKYEFTDKLSAGKIEVVSEAKNGYNDVTYTDIYVNGVYTSYREEKTVVVEQPVQAHYLVGNGSTYYDTGGLSFRLPVEVPYICCAWYCYPNHRGTDFQNWGNLYGYIYACEDGVVISRGYQSDMGNYYEIDHGNGYIFYYMHMHVTGYCPVGTRITKGQIIGQIGSTGRSSAPHVHIAIYVDGQVVDPCSGGLLPCEDAINW